MNLYHDAAMRRAEADWLVGINATRALTCKYNAQLSCGRVQTPTLAMIAEREEQITALCAKAILWASGGQKGRAWFTWQDAETGSSARSFDKERVEGLLDGA